MSVRKVENTKLLRVTFYCDLTWNKHAPREYCPEKPLNATINDEQIGKEGKKGKASALGKTRFSQFFGWPLWDGGGVPVAEGYLDDYQVATVFKRERKQ